MIFTIVVALIILSILVLVHEFGHFIVGKICGVGVKEFALGLPFTRAIWSKKLKDGMKISVYPMLFGGFVSLLGEEGPADAKAMAGEGIKGKYFYQVGVWQRIGVVVAGVIMNFILAVLVFYLFLGLSNFKVLLPKLADYKFLSPNKTVVAVSYVMDPSPASEAGLKPGDVILLANGQSFARISDFQSFTKEVASNNGTMKLEISDVFLESTKTVTVMPRKNPPVGQGAMGIGISNGIILNYQNAGQKAASGLSYSVDMLGYNIAVLKSFGQTAIKSGNVEPLADSVSGPVGIVNIVGDVLSFGGKQAVISLLNLMALLSLSLAFMNILPIPAMDGGRLLFLLIEAVTRKKLPQKYENRINQVGMILLLGLIVLISFNDLSKIILPLIQR